MYILPLRETCIAYVHDATPCGCMGNAHAPCIYAHALCWEVHGMARPAPKRPPPPAVRPATCLRRRPIARMHGQHPSGPDFVFSRRPRAGMHTSACAPRSPGPVRAGLQNNCAPAITGMCIHQHPPCPLHVRSHVPISACSIRTSAPNAPTGLANSISNQYCAWACAGDRAFLCR